MKKLFLGLFSLTLFFISCKEKETVELEALTQPFPGPNLLGNYRGVFTYTTPERQQKDTVSLVLKIDGYESGRIGKHSHMGGAGTYELIKDSMTFNDEGYYTADFDWGLILSGIYTVSFNGKELKLSKQTTTGDYKYEYHLLKQ